MCVTPSPSRTRVRSSWICSGSRLSKRRRPWQKNDVDLELVEDAGGERELRDCGAVHQHDRLDGPADLGRAGENPTVR